jgi:hypothetical protein
MKDSNKRMDRPLMLWCSSHSTLAREEIPMFLQAGFRVIPLLTDFWTYQYDPELDSKLCQDWKESVGLPAEIVRRLQAISFCGNSGRIPFDAEEIELLNRHVDVLYVTVLPNLAIRLADVFHGTVIFRPFGHGALNNYTNIARHLNAVPEQLVGKVNYHWVPILSTLQEIEDPRVCANATHLGAYVTESRLGGKRWSPSQSQPYVVETIPRINKQQYYLDIYHQYRKDHGHLPLRILGGNQPRGGDIGDDAIIGFLSDEEYYNMAVNARVSIYHGRSRYHIHYHPIEFMAIGVPVLFHSESAFASEAMHFGVTCEELQECGMYHTVEQANLMADAALRDHNLADDWSRRQRLFLERVFCRETALHQARWLRTRTIQLKNQKPSVQDLKVIPTEQAPADTLGPTFTKKPLMFRVGRELKRAWRRRVVGPLTSQSNSR